MGWYNSEQLCLANLLEMARLRNQHRLQERERVCLTAFHRFVVFRA